MKVIQPNCRVQFAAEDIDFIVSVLGRKIGTAKCLIQLLADEGHGARHRKRGSGCERHAHAAACRGRQAGQTRHSGDCLTHIAK